MKKIQQLESSTESNLTLPTTIRNIFYCFRRLNLFFLLLALLGFASCANAALFVNSTSASNITTTGADLNTNVYNSSGIHTVAVGFEWGLTNLYGNLTTTTNVLPGDTINISRSITGLSCGTTYHFKASFGPDATFTTTACPDPTPTLTFSTPTSASVNMGASLTNVATSSIPGGPTIVYDSSNIGVATVSSSGVITSVGVGTSTITATQPAQVGHNAEATATYTLTVSRATINDAVNGSVTGTLVTQVTISQRLTDTQIKNVSDHVQSLRRNFNVKNNQIALNVSSPTLDPIKQAIQQMGAAFTQAQVKVAQNNVVAAGDMSITDLGAGYIKLAQADALPSDISVTNTANQEVNFNDVLFGDKQMGVWASGTFDYGSISHNDFRTSGATVGIDYQFNPHVIIGVAIGYGFDNTDIDTLGTDVKSHQTTGSVYGVYQTENDWFVDALLGYGDLKLKNNRYSSAADSVFSANRNGDTVFGSVSVAKLVKVDRAQLQPYARLTQMSSTLNAYNEGSNADALAYNKAKVVSRALSAGFTASYDIALETGKLTPSAKFELRHNARGSLNQTISYADTPAESMVYSLTPAPDNIQSLGFGLAYQTKKGIISDVSWLASTGSNSYHSNALKLNVRLPF